jgi:phosphatidylserine/phosphatidylglycerophosphate/cardiolipin synthase-like enzyme
VKTALLLLLLAMTARANLLGNPGFESWEDDSTPAAWRVEQRSRTRVERATDTVRTGAAALRLTRLETGSSNNYGVVQTVPVTGGGEYRYRAWCREDAPEMRVGVGVSWRRADSSYLSASRVRYSVDGPGWQLIADTLFAPAEAALAEFRIRTYAPVGQAAPNSALVDDAFFAAPPAPGDTARAWFARDSLARRLIAFFDSARHSIDYCCYNSSRPDVNRALLDAHARGVRVRVITDDRRLGNDWVLTLRAAGVPVWTDSIGPGAANYMHNKFAVRDLANADSTDDRAWCASYNPNVGELRADFALELPHPGIARAFRFEFEQMWGDTGMTPNPARARFHRGKADVQPTHRFDLDGHEVEVYFAPQDRPVDTVAARVRAARRQVLFAIFSYTHDGLGDAMLGRWAESVWVGGVIDRSGINLQGSEYPRLVAAGIPVFEDSVPFGEKILHEKIMVIDSAVTVAGSANWSANGNEYNDEFLLVLHGPALANRFLGELHQRFWEATNPGIAEAGAAGRRARPAATVVRAGAFRFEPAVEAYDAAGRRVSGAPGPGVFYLVRDGRAGGRVVVIR